MPTLEPSRDGFTQTGMPIRADPRGQVRVVGGTEVDLWDAAIPQQSLEDQLVDRDRRREHSRPDVGDVEALEQALDGSVLAERAVEHRKCDVASEQALGRLDSTTGSPSASQRPSRSITTSTRLVAGGAQALGDGGAGSQRDRVLARAAAADHGDPHGELPVVVEVDVEVVGSTGSGSM